VTFFVQAVVAVGPRTVAGVMACALLLSSSPDCDQLHVPLWLPDWLMVPCEAVIVTASSYSANVPLALAAPVSAMLVDALVTATPGATSVTVNVKLVLAVAPSAFVAVIVTASS